MNKREHVRHIAEVRLANLRTLCEELEEIFASTEDHTKAFLWLDSLRYIEGKLSSVVRAAAVAGGLTAK